MTSRKLPIATLHHLFELRSIDVRPSVRALADRAGVRLKVMAETLCVLHDAGLVDATRLTLTLPGLAVAVASRAPQRHLELAA